MGGGGITCTPLSLGKGQDKATINRKQGFQMLPSSGGKTINQASLYRTVFHTNNPCQLIGFNCTYQFKVIINLLQNCSNIFLCKQRRGVSATFEMGTGRMDLRRKAPPGGQQRDDGCQPIYPEWLLAAVEYDPQQGNSLPAWAKVFGSLLELGPSAVFVPHPDPDRWPRGLSRAGKGEFLPDSLLPTASLGPNFNIL